MPFVPNPRQRDAIEHVRGPMLVVAGAGTGKTTVLTRRIAWLVEQGHARPDEVLAVTFTINATAEMKERVAELLGESRAAGVQVANFHSYCFDLVKRCGRGFEVLNDQDLWVYLRRRIRELPLGHFLRAANPAQFLNNLCDFFARCQDELVSPDDYAAYVASLETPGARLPRVGREKEELSREQVLERCREIAAVYRAMDGMLARDNLGTFGMQIVRAVELLRADPGLLRHEQQRARFVLVDEFQDSNLAQIELLRLLAGEERNVFAVGDPDQAIYRFRGASSAAFDEFLRRFPDARTVTLDENRRSTSLILRSAYSVIRQNPELVSAAHRAAGLVRAPLRSGREEEAAARGRLFFAAPVEVVIADSYEEEAAEVARRIDELRQQGVSWPSMAVLYRQHNHRLELLRELAERDIPFLVVGTDLLDTDILRDLLALLRALNDTGDHVSLFRLAVMPAFKLDLAEFQARLAAGRAESVAAVLADMPAGVALLKKLEQTRAALDTHKSELLPLVERLLSNWGFDRSREEVQRFLKFVEEWQKKTTTTTRALPEFVEYLDYFKEAGGRLEAELPERADAVRLMSAHVAKGLEFEHVFVMRAVQGSFPVNPRLPLFEFPPELRRSPAAETGDEKEVQRQEERRLFYVAMTRARDTLALTAKAWRGKQAVPAGFLRDLEEDRQELEGALVFRPAQPLTVAIQAQAEMPELLSLPPRPGLAGKLSASAVELYEQCPLQFRFARDWRIPGEVSAATQYGGTIHQILRDYFESIRAGRPHPVERVLENFRTLLAEAGIADAYQRELYLRDGLAQLREFVEARQGEPPIEVLHTERNFSVQIGGATVVGRIDRIDRLGGDLVRIVDYKTGRAKTENDARDSLQLSLYALAAERQWELRAGSLVFYNLENNSAVETTRERKHLDAAEEKVGRVAAHIAAGDFRATPGFHCRWCSYRALCPETEERLYSIAAAAAGGVRS